MGASVLALVGPTCSGKSAVALDLARRFGCAVLSADSMQVYRGMDIGTGKVFDASEDVRMYGIDLVELGEPYSAALYQEYGRDVIAREVAACGRIIVCGGTGFYVRALLDGMDFAPGEQEGNPVRERYTLMAEEEGVMAVWQELRRIDPESAAAVHPNNVKRVIRALEMAAEGESYARRADAFADIEEAIPATYVAFDLPREVLYERINARVDLMIERGLVNEVRGLLCRGLRDAITARQAIGYKEIIDYLDGVCTVDEAVAAIKQATRRYAKRQLSWFRRESRITWLDGTLPQEERAAAVARLSEWL